MKEQMEFLNMQLEKAKEFEFLNKNYKSEIDTLSNRIVNLEYKVDSKDKKITELTKNQGLLSNLDDANLKIDVLRQENEKLRNEIINYEKTIFERKKSSVKLDKNYGKYQKSDKDCDAVFSNKR